MGTAGTITTIVLLLAANGFFVAAEFALVKARGFRLEALAVEGGFGARLAVRIQKNLEPYLAACQLGITMASLGLGWIGEPAVAAVLEPLFVSAGLPDTALHTVSFLLGFIIFSSLHIVIGEQVPKTFAIRKAEPVSLAIAYPLHAFYVAMYPLNWLLNRASGGILAWFGVEEATHAEVFTSDEFKTMVLASEAQGEFEPTHAKMLANLFAFDERAVGRVMIPRGDVSVLDLSATPEENTRVIAETGHSRFPVVDGKTDLPLGIVVGKDLYAGLLAEGSLPWERLRELTREPLVVPETIRISGLFEIMREQRAHLALVVDEYGSFAGIATLEDLLEEIVGEIVDEHEVRPTTYSVERKGDGWLADGLASLADVERITGLAVPDDLDANTLSGLFLQRLERMPEVGDAIEESGFRLEVTRVDAHRVDQVGMSLTEGTPGPPTPDAPDPTPENT